MNTFYFASTYNSGAYGASTYQNGTTTTSSSATTGTTAGNGAPRGVLTNTGFDVALAVTAAAVLCLIAVLVRFWKRPAAPASAE